MSASPVLWTRPVAPERWRLLVIADLAPGHSPPADRLRAALRGGATSIELRGKGVDTRAFFEAACALLPVCREFEVPLLINDRPDIARAADADGAHVGPGDLPPGEARSVLGPALLGVSARNVERVRAAERAGADYLGTGALRATESKPEAVVVGLAGIAAIAASTRLPVIAIGGVRPQDAPALKRAGIAGMAVLGGVLAAPDPEEAARAYRRAWDGA